MTDVAATAPRAIKPKISRDDVIMRLAMATIALYLLFAICAPVKKLPEC
jgi:hypothetical protein